MREDRLAWLAFGLAVAAGLALSVKPAEAAARRLKVQYDNKFDSIFQATGARLGIDWRLLKAVAMHESSLDPLATNPKENPEEAPDPSYGLMQISCVPDGRGGCRNHFNIAAWPPPSARALLTNPSLNVLLGAEILRANLDEFRGNVWRAVAAYNDYSGAVHNPAFPYGDPSYVSAVQGFYRALGGPV